MYKKRFTKWGFYKNTRRNRMGSSQFDEEYWVRSHVNPKCISTKRRFANNVFETTSPFLLIDICPSDRERLAFFSGIQAWSSAFFESAASTDDSLSTLPSNPSSPKVHEPYYATERKADNNLYESEQLSFSFRVIVGLLQRGQGVLAGRLARKAFLQIEGLLQAEPPLFIWNILEILYSITRLEETQLLHLLLRHMQELVRRDYPDPHPVTPLLQSLQRLLNIWKQDLVPFQVTVLERGWAVNANMILDNFDSKFLLLYYHLVWDSELVQLPNDKLSNADNWFSLESKTKTPTQNPENFDSEFRVHRELSMTGGLETRARMPDNYEQLKTDCITNMHHMCTLEYKSLRNKCLVMSGLLKSRVLQHKISSPSFTNKSRGVTSQGDPLEWLLLNDETNRFHARILAFIMKTLLKVQLEEGLDVGRSPVSQLRDIVTLREYGQSITGPQTVHGMWELAENLLKTGEVEEAAAICREAQQRLERFLNDVPVYVV